MKLNPSNILIYSVSLGFLSILVTYIILFTTSNLDKIDLTLRIYPLIFSGIITVATILLVKITEKYAESTAEILEEQRKSRQIFDIEKKLEFVYGPIEYEITQLKWNIEKQFSNPETVKVIGREKFRYDLDSLFSDFINKIMGIERHYGHLFGEDLKEVYDNTIILSKRYIERHKPDIYSELIESIGTFKKINSQKIDENVDLHNKLV